MSHDQAGLCGADIEQMAVFWGMNPAAIGSCLFERETRIRHTGTEWWPQLWGELLARSTDGLRDGLARRLLSLLDVKKACPETLARMAMDWRGQKGGQHWSGHREQAWYWLSPWMACGEVGLVEKVARLVGGGSMHVAMRHTASPLSDILATTGPRKWVSGDDDVFVPWIHAWAQEAILGSTPLLAEHALDLLVENGCDLDMRDAQGQRAIERLKAEVPIVTFAGKGTRLNQAHILIHMLMDRGAAWEDLELRVSPTTWRVIQSHPAARRARLGALVEGARDYHENERRAL